MARKTVHVPQVGTQNGAFFPPRLHAKWCTMLESARKMIHAFLQSCTQTDAHFFSPARKTIHNVRNCRQNGARQYNFLAKRCTSIQVARKTVHVPLVCTQNGARSSSSHAKRCMFVQFARKTIRAFPQGGTCYGILSWLVS